MSVDYDANAHNTIPPLSVAIVSDATKIEKRPTEIRSSHRTVVLTAANPYVQITGYDPARCEIRMDIMDNPVVLCRSVSAASDLNNTTGTMTAPNGRLMPPGVDYTILGVDELWLSTNTYPTRVGLSIFRQI
jgi:hypothetical protein